MKKILLLTVSVLGIAYLLTSCSDDDTNTRRVTYTLEVEESYKDKVKLEVVYLAAYKGDDEVYVSGVVDGTWSQSVEIKYAKVLGLKTYAGGEIKATVIAKEGVDLKGKNIEDILLIATIKDGNKVKATASGKGYVELEEDGFVKF